MTVDDAESGRNTPPMIEYSMRKPVGDDTLSIPISIGLIIICRDSKW